MDFDPGHFQPSRVDIGVALSQLFSCALLTLAKAHLGCGGTWIGLLAEALRMSVTVWTPTEGRQKYLKNMVKAVAVTAAMMEARFSEAGKRPAHMKKQGTKQ